MEHKYIFKKLTDESKYQPAGNTFDFDMENQEVAEIWGSLITLFGQTQYVENDMEEAFTYFLEAVDEENHSICFTLYYGSIGLEIGIGEDSLDDLNKAEEMVAMLMNKLRETTPTDFDYVGYYWDYGCKVELGVVNGKGYARDVELDEDEDE